MRKVVRQMAVSCVVFVAVLSGLARVDWLSCLKLENNFLEKRLGDIFWNSYVLQETCLEDDSLLLPVDSLLTFLCEANGVNREKIKLHVVQSEEVNAFVFPDNHLVIHTSLIKECLNEMELCGVMAHEMVHIQKGHVMQKLIKSSGLSLLLSSVEASSGILADVLQKLTSTAYERSLEAEADAGAVRYLMAAGIDSEPLADFLLRMDKQEDRPQYAVWVSTHSGIKERAAMIIDLAGEKQKECKQVLGTGEWEKLQEWLIRMEETTD